MSAEKKIGDMYGVRGGYGFVPAGERRYSDSPKIESMQDFMEKLGFCKT